MSERSDIEAVYMELLGVHAELRELKAQSSLELLSVQDIGAALGLGKSATYKLLARPDAPKKIRLSGTCVRYRKKDVEKFLDSLSEN